MVKKFIATTLSAVFGLSGLFNYGDLPNTTYNYNNNVVYASETDAYADDNNIGDDFTLEADQYSGDEWSIDMLSLEEFNCDLESSSKMIDESRINLINQMQLRPMKTNDAEIDARVQEILSNITIPGMSTYQKTEAIWNWIISNTYYQVDPGKWRQSYASVYDTRTVAMSYSVLFKGYGSCANYAAAFVVMTRAIGLKSYLVGGKFVNRSGSTFDHYWVNMKLGNELYTFDPQIEDNMWNGKGNVPKTFFCKNDSEVSSRYIYGDKYGNRDDYINGFNCFSLKGKVNDDLVIKGICQMPYTGAGGGYLIGVETYENPNQEYQYELLVLDCTLLAQGKDAWIYTTNKCHVKDGTAFWTVWQPIYGYYWTLFRVYDKYGNLLDEKCYGFENIA